MLIIGPDFLDMHASVGGHARELARAVLVGVLSDNGFTLGEVDGFIADVDCLVCLANEMGFDPAEVLVVDAPVFELL